mmetsp:Transcript_13121/g.15919  ORF Transcript_13121/g.15919 Transcript_13121/m.15919 type:complete len:298 (-) Transcript_13121:112-1005(-)
MVTITVVLCLFLLVKTATGSGSSLCATNPGRHIPVNGCESLESQTDCNEFGCCFWKNGKRCRLHEKFHSPVLFIGNSFTARNQMSKTFYKLARSAGENPVVSTRTIPSSLLAQHLSNSGTLDVISSRNRWHSIVFQEQSAQLSFTSYPGTIRSLLGFQELIEGKSDNMFLFLTWGYLNGQYPDFSYVTMQDRLIKGYENVASRLVANNKNISVSISPVGRAWLKAFDTFGLKLYTNDGRHPSKIGSFLAALVHYSFIYGKSPFQTDYKPTGVSKNQAKQLKEIANITFQQYYLENVY